VSGLCHHLTVDLGDELPDDSPLLDDGLPDELPLPSGLLGVPLEPPEALAPLPELPDCPLPTPPPPWLRDEEDD